MSVLESTAERLLEALSESVQADVDISEALVRLRARAYASERPIVELAHDVVDGSLFFGDDTLAG